MVAAARLESRRVGTYSGAQGQKCAWIILCSAGFASYFRSLPAVYIMLPCFA